MSLSWCGVWNLLVKFCERVEIFDVFLEGDAIFFKMNGNGFCVFIFLEIIVYLIDIFIGIR